MDLFALSATLGLDTSAFESALDGLDGMLSGPLGFVGKTAGKLVSKGMAMAGNAVVEFGKDVIRTGLEADEALSGVYAVTETTDEATQAMLRSAAATEAQRSAFTVAEVAMAEYYEGLAGYDTDEIIAGLRGIVLAAEASGESLPLVADILTDTTTAFGDSAKEQERYADVLAATATNSNTTIGKLGQALKYVAPIAGSFGYEIEDVALFLGLAADNAIKGSQAGTSLRNILTRLATDGGATAKDMGALSILTDRLGVEFYDASGKVRPLIDVLKEARQAWRGMDEEGRKEVAGMFGELALEGASADEVLKEFASDTKNVQAALEGFNLAEDARQQEEYSAEIRGTAKAYQELFNALGINIDPAKDDLGTLADAFEKARIRMGEMTDEEKIFYAKQIGSLRGMSEWLAVMNVADDEFDNLAESVYNAAGAAERMRDIRMGSNLAGDVKSLNAALDVLKIAVYDDVDGPLRMVTQHATASIRLITKAIQRDGIEGGIKQLSIEIRGFSKRFAPVLESIGKMLVPIVETVLTDLAPAILEGAKNIGGAFAQGLADGFLGSENMLFSTIGTVLSGILNPGHGNERKLDLTALLGKGQITAEVVPTLKSQQIQEAIDAAQANGETTIMIDGLEFPIDEPADQIARELGYVGLDAGIAIGQNIANGIATNSDTAADHMKTSLKTAGEESALSVGNDLYAHSVSMAEAAANALSFKLSSAGLTGGEGAANNVFDKIKSVGTSIKETLDTSMGKAGKNAGGSIASKIQKALSAFQFGISIVGTLTSIFGGGSRRYASAMYDGKVLHGATIFGMSAGGSPLVGGEAGPEAVVGTGELGRLITDAVTAASGGGNYTVNVYQQPGEDMDALVRRIEREIVRKERQRRSALA